MRALKGVLRQMVAGSVVTVGDGFGAMAHACFGASEFSWKLPSHFANFGSDSITGHHFSIKTIEIHMSDFELTVTKHATLDFESLPGACAFTGRWAESVDTAEEDSNEAVELRSEQFRPRHLEHIRSAMS